MPPVFTGNSNTFRPDSLSRNGVYRERILGKHNFRRVIGKTADNQLQHIIGTITQCDLLGPHAQALRQLSLQVKTIAIRIEAHVVQCLAGSTHCQRAWPKRVFITGKLDNRRRVEPQFTGDLINWLTWLIGLQLLDAQYRQRFEINRHGFSCHGLSLQRHQRTTDERATKALNARAHQSDRNPAASAQQPRRQSPSAPPAPEGHQSEPQSRYKRHRPRYHLAKAGFQFGSS